VYPTGLSISRGCIFSARHRSSSTRPRFQTPDTESNATVLFRDMLIGGPNKDALLRERQLEPGIRDCVAIVIMPSFVPNVTCDATSNGPVMSLSLEESILFEPTSPFPRRNQRVL